MDEVVAEWRASRADAPLLYETDLRDATPIIAESTLKQGIHNILDNALEASGSALRLSAATRDGWIRIVVEDDGPGFTSEALADFGKPYNSTKGRAGSGLGLFLLVNVLRKLGGVAEAENLVGGARVSIRLPVAMLEVARHG